MQRRAPIAAMLTRCLFTTGLVFLANGCRSAPKKPEVCTPRPLVEWRHVATESAKPAPNAFQIVSAEPTVGLFPANLGVTRVAIQPDGSPVLMADPRNEFLQWNSTLDDQMAISEVFPVQQRDLGGGEAVPEQIVAAFRALHARLGLIYAVNELRPDETEMFGALYDSETGKLLAVLAAQAQSCEPVQPDQKKEDDPFQVWETDSRARVRAEFASLVHQCIRTLIQADRPQMIEAPAGWKPEFPRHPAHWPPRHPSYP